MTERVEGFSEIKPAAPLPSYKEFSIYNSPFLQLDAKNIVGNPSIPRKIQNRILLQKVGIKTDRSSMHFPPDIFFEKAYKIVQEARDEGWLGLGVGTALLSEQGHEHSTPSVRIRTGDSKELIDNKLEIIGGLGSGDFYTLYHNRWDDVKNCIGASILYLNNPNECESIAERAFIIEFARGIWPRDFGKTEGNLPRITKEMYRHSPKIENYKPSDLDLEYVKRLLLNFALSSQNLDSIGEFMSAVNKPRLRLDFESYGGNLTPLDANF